LKCIISVLPSESAATSTHKHTLAHTQAQKEHTHTHAYRFTKEATTDKQTQRQTKKCLCSFIHFISHYNPGGALRIRIYLALLLVIWTAGDRIIGLWNSTSCIF